MLKNFIEGNANIIYLTDNKQIFFKELLKAKNYNIIHLDFNSFIKKDGWNILDYPYQLYKNKEMENCLEYLKELSTHLLFADTQNEFWKKSANQLFIDLCLRLFEDEKEDINLLSVYNVLDYPYLDNYLKSTNSAYIKETDEVRAAIVSLLKQQLKTFISQKEDYLLTKTTFDLEKKPVIIIIEFNKEFNLSKKLVKSFLTELKYRLKDISKYKILLNNEIIKLSDIFDKNNS